MLGCAEKAVKSKSRNDIRLARKDRLQRPSTKSESPDTAIDVAHAPYAIYYATLILWCGVAAIDGQSSLIKSSHLARGRDLLSRQKLRIATLLEHVLRDVDK
jgi:hypothetical protein